jgi:hypothetical protein
MKDRKYVHASIRYSVYETIVALKNLSDFLSADFTNNLPGMWEFAKPTDRFPQASHVRRCSRWSITRDMCANGAEVFASLASPVNSTEHPQPRVRP